MSDTKQRLQRAREAFPPPEDVMGSLTRRRAQKDRNRRIGTAVLALVLATAALGGLARAFLSGPGPRPADQPSRRFVGTWTSTDVDGRTRTMVIRASGEDAYEITVQNHLALVCAGAPSTLTGTGQLSGSKLVMRSLEITCDDGSEPKIEDDLPPPEELLRDLTFEHDLESDILTNYSPLESRRVRGNGQVVYNGLTLVWGRAEAENRIGDVSGWITYGDKRGIWARDLTSPRDPADRILLSSTPGTPTAWSPDGSRLLVLREVPRGPDAFPHTDLFVLNADGTETRLTDANGWLDSGSFSPDGSQVVYATVDDDHPHRSFVWVIDASGGDPRPVHRTDVHLDHPTFSPDGRLIAYFEGGGDHSNILRVMNADGSGSRILVEREFGHIRGLQWSPDGSRLVFASGGIWVVGADGTGLKQVSSEEIDGTDPSWSPDGSHIAYTRDGSLEVVRLDDLQVQNFGDGASGPWTAELGWRAKAP